MFLRKISLELVLKIFVAMKHLKKNYEIQELDAPNDICWLYGSFMDDYLHDVEICQRFARRSRERMAEIIIERTKMTRTEAFHTIHNYIDVNEIFDDENGNLRAEYTSDNTHILGKYYVNWTEWILTKAIVQ